MCFILFTFYLGSLCVSEVLIIYSTYFPLLLWFPNLLILTNRYLYCFVPWADVLCQREMTPFSQNSLWPTSLQELHLSRTSIFDFIFWLAKWHWTLSSSMHCSTDTVDPASNAVNDLHLRPRSSSAGQGLITACLNHASFLSGPLACSINPLVQSPHC